MLYSKIFSAVALAAVAYAEAEANPEPANNKGGNNAATSSSNSGSGSTGTSLLSNVIQSGSFVSGAGAIGSESGQALSATSQNNFINTCSGKTLTNGLQITGGSCNGIRKSTTLLLLCQF